MSFEQDFNDYIEYLEDNILSGESEQRVIYDAGRRFSRVEQAFSGLCGITPREYLRNRRLYFAAKDLLDGNTIGDVVVIYSFYSYSTFSKAFKNMFGVPPTRFDKSMLKEYGKLHAEIRISGAGTEEKENI